MLSKKNNKKGFTLMEMLIVVAIIAVLIAIAIPTFTTSLNKARIATDEANIRSGYASTVAAVLTDGFDVEQADGATAVYTLNKDGSVTKTTAGAAASGTPYQCLATNDAGAEIGGVKVDGWDKGQTVTYTYTYETNSVAVSFGAAGN